MGNVTSKQDDASPLFVKDQSRRMVQLNSLEDVIDKLA